MFSSLSIVSTSLWVCQCMLMYYHLACLAFVSINTVTSTSLDVSINHCRQSNTNHPANPFKTYLSGACLKFWCAVIALCFILQEERLLHRKVISIFYEPPWWLCWAEMLVRLNNAYRSVLVLYVDTNDNQDAKVKFDSSSSSPTRWTEK